MSRHNSTVQWLHRTCPSTVTVMGGALMVGVSADMHEKAGVIGGDTVDVEIARNIDGEARSAQSLKIKVEVARGRKHLSIE